MPYEQHWVPAPKDKSLPLLEGDKENPPFGFALDERFWMGSFATAKDLSFERAYFCRHCGGWISGLPNHYRVNTLGVLSGRQGTEYHCRRCGEKIGFRGRVA